MAEQTNPVPVERRENHILREVLDELLILVREVSSRHTELSDTEIEYTQERIQWLADEVWRLAMEAR